MVAKRERRIMWCALLLSIALGIANHYSHKFEQDLAAACKGQTGYTEHKKVGRSWYCKSSEWSSLNSTEHWQKLRRN